MKHAPMKERGQHQKRLNVLCFLYFKVVVYLLLLQWLYILQNSFLVFSVRDNGIDRPKLVRYFLCEAFNAPDYYEHKAIEVSEDYTEHTWMSLQEMRNSASPSLQTLAAGVLEKFHERTTRMINGEI